MSKSETNSKLEIGPVPGIPLAGRESENGYDLEERTAVFAEQVRAFIRRLPHTISNSEDVRQLVRSSGSIAANYIEANECLGKKDFLLHIKISRKESKESRLWLRLLFVDGDQQLEADRRKLVQESTELMNIFGAIFQKSQGRTDSPRVTGYSR